MRFKKLFIGTIIIGLIISGYWIILYSTSFSRFYVQKDYSSDLNGFHEIIEKVEHFDYDTYLNCSLDDHLPKPNYINAEILENFSQEIEENRIKYTQYPYILGILWLFYENNIEYSFQAQNSSYFNYTFYNNTDNSPDSIGLIMKSNIFNDTLIWDINRNFCSYINESFFLDPNQIGEEREISDIIIVQATFRMVYADNTCLYYFKQLLVLTPQLDVVFIGVYEFIFGCSV